MMNHEQPTPTPPFWQALVLAVVAAAVTPLAHHAGKAFREHLARRARAARNSDE
jgi:hypothetical protein